MRFMVENYKFEGPFTSPDQIEEKPGLFAVYCFKDGGYYIIDIDESENIRNAIKNHERINCWIENSKEGIITFSVYYTPHLDQKARKKIEKEIRSGETFLPCGS